VIPDTTTADATVGLVASDERSMRDRMLACDLYVADDPMLTEESRRAMALPSVAPRRPPQWSGGAY
jgi:hypothetical protein